MGDRMTKTLHLLLAAAFAVSMASPALAASSKAAHHAKPAKAAPAKPLSDTDRLNEQSLAAARAGQNAPAPK